MTPDDPILQFFMGYAYEPTFVYLAIVTLLFASSFGLPFPEEATLLSAGLIAHIGSNPHIYPPPDPAAAGVSVATTAIVCFLAVLLSDLLVFALGKHFGPRLLRGRRMSKIMTPAVFDRISAWTQKVGPFACGVFRFTPGLRFPGHFSCGCFGISYSKFLLIDGTAALLTVPTQVVLMAYFGQEILGVIKEVKIYLGIAILCAVLIYLGKRLVRSKSSSAKATAQVPVVRQTTDQKAS